MKPPFAYFGGKTAIAERIAALLPPHEHYVEPFAGSLAVLLAKPPSLMETVNDLDCNLMNFWRVLRDRPEELERACALTPHSRAGHDEALVIEGDDLERARRVWIRLTQSRGGHLGQHGGWRFYQNARGSGHSMPDYLSAYVARIAPAVSRLMQVSLECRPALEVIAGYGQHPGCLIYADPPYLDASRSWSGNSYGHEMRGEEDHRQLAEALRGVRGSVVLSGYASPLYSELYKDWCRTEMRAFAGNGNAPARTEVLWSNRPFPGWGSLFDDVEDG